MPERWYWVNLPHCWNDIDAPEGYFSLNDKLEDIMDSEEGNQFFMQVFRQMAGGNVAVDENPGMMQMMGGFTVLRLVGLMGTAGAKITKEQLLGINAQLNQIKKSE